MFVNIYFLHLAVAPSGQGLCSLSSPSYAPSCQDCVWHTQEISWKNTCGRNGLNERRREGWLWTLQKWPLQYAVFSKLVSQTLYSQALNSSQIYLLHAQPLLILPFQFQHIHENWTWFPDTLRRLLLCSNPWVRTQWDIILKQMRRDRPVD